MLFLVAELGVVFVPGGLDFGQRFARLVESMHVGLMSGFVVRSFSDDGFFLAVGRLVVYLIELASDEFESSLFVWVVLVKWRDGLHDDYGLTEASIV